MTRSRYVFTLEFKQECVKLDLLQGYDVAQAASSAYAQWQNTAQ